MEWTELAARPLPWNRSGADAGAQAAGEHAFILSTRLLSYRNFAGEPFPVSASPQVVLALAEKGLARFSRGGPDAIWRLEECGPEGIRLLRERNLLPDSPVSLPGKAGGKYLLLDAGERSWTWLNEAEHVTRHQVFPGLVSGSSFAAVYVPPVEGENRHPWAWTDRHGYLASDPSRIGPGFSVEVSAHLPALALGRKLAQVHNALSALGLGFFPVTSSAAGETDSCLFRLTFQGGWGRDAAAVYRKFLETVQPLWNWETDMQRRCREKQPKRLEDRVFKSLSCLANARVLPYPEMLAWGSWARMGAYLGFLNPQIPSILEELRVITRSGHLRVSSGKNLAKEEEDILRANVVRLSLEGRCGIA